MSALEPIFLAFAGVDNAQRKEAEAILDRQKESDPAGVRCVALLCSFAN